VLSLNPKLVRGHQLLALLYIKEGKYDLAKKSLRNAGKIDANNTITLRYLKEANAGIRENNPGKKTKSDDDLVSYQSGNETIIQPRYLKENSAFTTVINVIIGLVIGVAVTCFLVVPGVRHSVQESSKSQVLEANNTIASKNQQISTLEAQIEDMSAQITDAVDADEQKDSQISTYEQLLAAYVSYQEGDIESAGSALSNVNVDYLDGSAKTTYDTINAQVNAEYLSTMYREGTAAYSAKTYDTAIDAFTKVVELDETYENGNALYYLAQSLRRNENLSEAKVYYQKFVELYPGTERAANAQNYINIEED
jgi:TolA-binding protein